MGGPWITETIAVAMRNKNVYIDLSDYEKLPGSEQYIQAANGALSDKIMFASAHPFNNFKMMVKRYSELPFTSEVREKVMCLNAAKFLGLRQN